MMDHEWAFKDEYDQLRGKLVAIHNALDDALGDTDPIINENMTDNEIREEEPVFWAAVEIAKLIGPGPWDNYKAALQEAEG